MPPNISDPAQPKLPAVKSLPFQPDSGSHTSILISESMLGFNVAATRQKAGFGAPVIRPATFMPGRLKTPCAACGMRYSPAPTDSVLVIVAAGNAIFARAPHALMRAAVPAAKASNDAADHSAMPAMTAARRI